MKFSTLFNRALLILTLFGWGITSMQADDDDGISEVIITTQPANLVDVEIGSTITFSVTAQGQPPFEYVWRLNGIKIPDETNPTLLLTNVQPSQGGKYSVVVFDRNQSSDDDHGEESNIKELTLNLPSLGLSDDFPTNTLIVSNAIAGAGRGNNSLADKQDGEPKHANKKGGHSVWFNWRAPANGIVTFRTAGSHFDTLLGAYSGSAVDALVPVTKTGGDDDSGGFLTSKLSFNVQAGTLYRIAIDGDNQRAGEIVLSWLLVPTLSPDEDLPVFLSLPKGRTVFSGSDLSLGAAYTGPSGLIKKWYFNGATVFEAGDTLVLTNIQRNKVGKYIFSLARDTGNNIETPFTDIQISTDPNNVARTNLALDKFSDAVEVVAAHRSRQRTLQATRLPNTTPATGYRGTQIFNTYGSSKEPGEPNHCGVLGGASAWYLYEASRQGEMRINTDGSEFDTVVAVYADPQYLGRFENLVEIACDNNSGPDGLDSSVSFVATNGGLYYIAIDGVSGVTGVAVLNYNLGGVPLITQQPEARTAVKGSNTQFQVVADSTEEMSYQWRWNNNVLAGETNSILILNNVQETQAGLYQVVISTTSGSVTSSLASLSVVVAPSITNPPRHLTVHEGEFASFNVLADGTLPLIFQWILNNAPVPGGTNQQLSIASAQTSHAGNYFVVVRNAGGSVTSTIATLTVQQLNLPPTVSLTAPSHGQLVSQNPLTVLALAQGSAISKVEFFRSTTKLHEDISAPYSMVWTNPPTGSHDLIAVATDQFNRKGTSAVVRITVDGISPQVTMNFPASGARLTNASTLLSGSALDASGVSRVEIRLNQEPVIVAAGTTNWQASVILSPGSNSVRVRAYDLANNVSTEVVRNFQFFLSTPLELQILGSGTVSPAPGVRSFEAGRVYRFTARPGTGHLFSHWSGDTNASNAVLNFRVGSNSLLRAHFVPNLFIPFKGSYQGLFFEEGNVRHESSGLATLNLTDRGAFSGRGWIQGVSRSFRGQFDLQGRASVNIIRLRTNSVPLTLNLDFSTNAQSDRIFGTLSNQGSIAVLSLDRSSFHARTNRPEARGNYTGVISKDTLGPSGHGSLTLSLDASGNVRLSGSLADGTAFLQGTKLSSRNQFPLFLNLYRGRGSSLGWMTFDSSLQETDLSGRWIWLKPSDASARFYPAGFEVDTSFSGSRYQAPAAGNRALNLSVGELLLQDGNLNIGITNPVQLLINHQLSFSNAPVLRPSFRVTPGNGRFSGSFVHPQTSRVTPFKGVVLQKGNEAAGYFLGTNASGSVLLRPVSE